MRDLDFLEIPYQRYQVWRKSVDMLGDAAGSVRQELEHMSQFPSRRSVARAASAARAVEAKLSGVQRGLASALASSLEGTAQTDEI